MLQILYLLLEVLSVIVPALLAVAFIYSFIHFSYCNNNLKLLNKELKGIIYFKI